MVPPGLGSSPPVIIANITRLGERPAFCRATAPAKKSRRLRMVVSMLSHHVFLRAFAYEGVVWSVRCRRWKPHDSQEELMVRRSDPGEEKRAEGPRHTPVQQGLNHLGLQHTDFQTTRGGRQITQLRAEPSEACPHETDTSSDFRARGQRFRA